MKNTAPRYLKNIMETHSYKVYQHLEYSAAPATAAGCWTDTTRIADTISADAVRCRC